MIRTRKQLEDALHNHDSGEVREIIIKLLQLKAQRRETLELVTIAISKGENLFEPDDGELRVLERENWSAGYCDELAEAVKMNFSLKKLQMYSEVAMELARNPEARKRGESIDEAARVMEMEIQDVTTPDSTPVSSAARPSRLTNSSSNQEKTDESPVNNPKTERTKKSAVKIIGYVLILMGIAAAIVGICVPVKFLIGLGIGVIMLGSAVTYLGINHEK